MDIRLYVANGQTVAHVAGEVIFKRGDPGDLMYVIKDGEVAITFGEDQTIGVGPGESFGEMALIDGHSRSADAVAARTSSLYAVDRSLFLILVHDTPYFALEDLQSLTERLRRANTVQG